MKRHAALWSVVGGVLLTIVLTMGNLKSQATNRQAAPRDVVINEIGWSGTACSPYDEWIELYNNTAQAIDLTGWTLAASDGTPTIHLSGAIPARDYFLLERQDDNTISDLPADQIYSGALEDPGETLVLDDGSQVIDTANGDGGGWPGGANNPDFSMERIEPTQPDSDANWRTNDGLTRNGLDCNGDLLNGTPKARNSATPLPSADLSVDKGGPATILPGAIITYTLVLSNDGQLPALDARLTDTLPALVEFITHTAAYPFSQPAPRTLVWELGDVPTTTAASPLTFTVAALVGDAAVGELTNVVTAASATTEGRLANNHAVLVTLVGSQPVTPVVLIEALHYYAYQGGDEAVRLMNVSSVTVSLEGWGLSDGDDADAFFPPGATLAPGQAVWCADEATAFEAQFGFKPDFETGDTDPAVPEMDGAWPGFANAGDECLLWDDAGAVADALVYRGGDTGVTGWLGPAVQPWSPSNVFGAAGQILYRKRDQATGQPTPDTDAAADWAQDPDDSIDGRKVQYPGWDLDPFSWTARVTETAVLTIAVAPDNLLDTVAGLLAGAQQSIWIEGYTFESAVLADALIERLGAGVRVTLLLEGGPAGGVEEAQKWISGQVRDAGGQVYFLKTAAAHARYRYQHAKFLLVDDRLALIGSENLNPGAMPADDKADGTAGRRGVYLITDAPGVVDRVRAILQADIDPAHHGDLVTCADEPGLCSGAPPLPEPDWTSYTVAFTEPWTLQGTFGFEVVQSPENSLRTADSLLGLIGRAGAGDTVLVAQFYEYTHWGPADGAPETDPNPRLEAYVEAARRGATVRILLDGYFDQGGDNAAAVEYLQGIARREGLDLQARRGNPTFLGLHNKMVLAHIGGQGYIHVGSINGSEASSKINRELALQVRSNGAYQYLLGVFEYDWRHSPLSVYLPLVVRAYQPPLPADHLLISEVFYRGSLQEEWVEIYNPTDMTIDLTTFKIGDAERMGKYEGMYSFPAGTMLGPRETLVVAASASTFARTYGRNPDFEFYETDLSVPTLARYEQWGAGEWELSNSGDHVLLLDGADSPLDVLVYGDQFYPGVTPHPGVEFPSHSLERYPPQFDTDDCSLDFRDWPFPNPGETP